jgi:hypothetical protein
MALDELPNDPARRVGESDRLIISGRARRQVLECLVTNLRAVAAPIDR